MSDIHVVVLAAGKGTRMKSQLPKVLHRIGGLTLIERVSGPPPRCGRPASPWSSATAPTRSGTSLAKRTRLQFVTQEQQLGTGHALLQTRPLLEGKTGTVVLLSGDVPLLAVDSLKALLATHAEAGAAATVITANLPRPFGYGRIVRTNGKIAKIVEERDATAAHKAITEINSGIYAFDLAPLFARARLDRHREQAGRVLPARSRRDLSQAEARRRDLDGRRAPTRFAASTAVPNLQRSAPWFANRRTKS